MDRNGNMSRKEACYFLGIRENASDEQIKRAYRYKAKLYHPDSNPSGNTMEYYIKVQKAYEYLMSNPYMPQNSANINSGTAYAQGQAVNNVNMQFYQQQSIRPAKIFAASEAVRSSYKKQKEMAQEREKIQKWDKDYRDGKKRQKYRKLYGEEYSDNMCGSDKSKEDEILDKIRAIWIAETIRRQIEHDKENKELLNRRKLYKAFMQHDIQDNMDR